MGREEKTFIACLINSRNILEIIFLFTESIVVHRVIKNYNYTW
jgi:hypothetical protein